MNDALIAFQEGSGFDPQRAALLISILIVVSLLIWSVSTMKGVFSLYIDKRLESDVMAGVILRALFLTVFIMSIVYVGN